MPTWIVVLRALGLGDLLAGLPALRALRRAGRGRVLLLAPAPLAQLVVRVGGADVVVQADHRLTPPEGGWRGVPQRPGLAVNLHGRGPQSTTALLGLQAEELLAYASPELGTPGPAWDPEQHEVARWMLLLAWAGIDSTLADLRIDPPAPPHGSVVLHPGASSGARRWPVERWAAVATALQRDGRRVLLTGSPGERGLCEDIARRADVPAGQVLAGRGNAWALVEVIGGADCIVVGDSGPGHVATATGTPSVRLFGPTSPARWGPVIDLERHAVLWTGRTGDPHAEEPFEGLLEIGVDEVLVAVRRVLDR